MFGYATNETEELMPLSVMLAHALTKRLAELRHADELPWLRPDCKSQVTVEYRLDQGKTVPIRIHTVLISTQHSPDITLDDLKAELQKVARSVIPSQYLDDRTIFHMQPSGAFVTLEVQREMPA